MRMVHFGQDGGTGKFKPEVDDVSVAGLKAFATKYLAGEVEVTGMMDVRGVWQGVAISPGPAMPLTPCHS
jgi:hypothetical protein